MTLEADIDMFVRGWEVNKERSCLVAYIVLSEIETRVFLSLQENR